LQYSDRLHATVAQPAEKCCVHYSDSFVCSSGTLLNIVACSTAIDGCATVAVVAEYCGVHYGDNLLCYSGSLLNIMVCSTAIDCSARVAVC